MINDTPTKPRREERSSFEIYAGRKKLYAIALDNGGYRVLGDCDVYQGASVELTITDAQAAELAKPRAERRLMQDILPEVPSEVREMLITGCSPAEWDHMRGEPIKHPKDYGCYSWDPEDFDADAAHAAIREDQASHDADDGDDDGDDE